MVPAYEEEVRQSFDRILREAEDFFVRGGRIHQALRDLTRRLDEAGIPYALLGALALAEHGLARLALNIDLLLTAKGLAEFRALYLGRGYAAAFPGAKKSFRDASTGVRIEVITTGEYPGDGLPKPVCFPDPSEAAVDVGGIRVVTLERLVELKLASGMTAAHRRRDLSDVQDLIRARRLPAAFGERLDRSVRAMFTQLWHEAQVQDPIQEE